MIAAALLVAFASGLGYVLAWLIDFDPQGDGAGASGSKASGEAYPGRRG